MTLQTTGKVEKGWGYEIVWTNNEKYSGKILIFPKAGAKTSLVYHKGRTKSWFVSAGQFKLRYVDIASGEAFETVLEEGKTADIGEGTPHQLEALVDNCVIYEVGTPDHAEDRVRLAPGDTQTSPLAQQ